MENNKRVITNVAIVQHCINKIYKENDKQKWIFIKNCALTFRLKKESIAYIFNFEIDNIISDIQKYSNDFGFDYLFKHDYTDQNIAQRKFFEFFTEFYDYYINKDREGVKKTLISISPAKYDLLKTRTKGTVYTEEETYLFVEYQIRYGLSTKALLKIFQLNEMTYRRRVEELKLNEKYKDIIREWEELNDYHAYCAKNNGYYL